MPKHSINNDFRCTCDEDEDDSPKMFKSQKQNFYKFYTPSDCSMKTSKAHFLFFRLNRTTIHIHIFVPSQSDYIFIVSSSIEISKVQELQLYNQINLKDVHIHIQSSLAALAPTFSDICASYSYTYLA